MRELSATPQPVWTAACKEELPAPRGSTRSPSSTAGSVHVTLGEPGELLDLETKLEDALEQGRLFGWTGEVGEDFFVNPKHVASLEIPTWLLQDPVSVEEDLERPDLRDHAD